MTRLLPLTLAFLAFPAFLAFLAILAAGVPARAAGPVTLPDLLGQMTELGRLAELPDPPYVTKQFSSYERLSVAPGRDTWFANHDRGFTLHDGTVQARTPYFKGGPMQGRGPDGHFPAGARVGLAPNRKPIGSYVYAYLTGPDGSPVGGDIPQGYIERAAFVPDPQGHVLAEMEGPGCLVRLWSANPQDGGRVRVFLDGAAEPAIDAPLADLLSGKWKATVDGRETVPFPDPFAGERSRGFNLYFPIAYQKHCKVTVTRPDIYYQVNYRSYPKGTAVETFRLSDMARHAGAVAAARARLKTAPGLPGEQSHTDLVTLAPGEKVDLGSDRPGAVTGLRVTVKQPEDEAAALRGLVLQASFDGAARPQVESPVGDFFGAGLGIEGYKTLPFAVRRSEGTTELTSAWPMPFEKGARLAVVNRGARPVKVRLAATFGPHTWTDRSLHFHARWRAARPNTRPFRDWTYAALRGQGVFVGDTLSVFNPVPAWWGEGDEKIYVDGEKFPSHFGTGTEDYYGYAWCDPTPFQHAYHNQTRCDGPGNRGNTTVNRFHVLDAIPYKRSFQFDMEVWHWTPNIVVSYAATTYWYARPGGTDDFPEIDPKCLQEIPSLPPPYRVAGLIEGEKLRVLARSDDFPLGSQDMSEFANEKQRWSGESHLWGRPTRAGAWADLALPVPADGTYRVIVYLTKARDYGIVRYQLSGQPVGSEFDGYSPDVVAAGPVDLGTVALKKGQATLRVEVTGSNPRADGVRFMWGLDGVMLKPVAK